MASARIVLVVAALLAARATADEHADAARAQRMAALIGIAAELERVQQAPAPTSAAEALDHVEAVERAIIGLRRTELDLDATVARLQHEELAAKNAHDLLEERHEDAVARWNIAAVLAGNGTTIAGSAMQFGSDRVSKWGDGLIIVGATVSAAFSVVALVKRDAGPLPAPIDGNMLAPFFDRAPTEASRYPPSIWRYLDAPLAGEAASIRRQLVDKWRRERRLPRAGDAAAAERRMRLLCEPLGGARRVDAAVLDDRADMLADVRERLGGLSVDLDLLWRQLHVRR